MRQLFLPACLCLVTWSGPTNSDSRLSLDEFTGSLSAKNYTATRMASLETGDVAEPKKPPADVTISDTSLRGTIDRSDVARTPAKPHIDPTAEEVAALVPDLAMESPVPSGVVINHGIPIGIPLPPVPKPVIARTEEEICSTLTEAAQRNDLPAPFLIRLLFQESRFEPGVVSHAGAQGIAQFMPATADSMGLDNPFDPLQAIPASARLLRELIGQFGNLGLAAAAYNAGPRRISNWLAARNKDKSKARLPEETEGYVKIITGKPVENWSAAHARHPEQKLPQRAPCQEAAGLLAWNGPDTVPLPEPSPRVVAAIAATKPAEKKPDTGKTHETKPAEAKSASKPVATVDAKTPKNSDINITRKGGRVSATIQIAEPGKIKTAPKEAEAKASDKPADKPAGQQVAARTANEKSGDQPKRAKIAQR